MRFRRKKPKGFRLAIGAAAIGVHLLTACAAGLLSSMPSPGSRADLIWPVTPNKPKGRYGLSGTFSAAELVRLAESMEPVRPARQATPHRAGC